MLMMNMKKLRRGLRRTLGTVLILVLIATNVIGQNGNKRTITGTVTDAESGETIIGANLWIKGTTVGTTTNFDGQYTIDSEMESDVLVVSFIGYKQLEKAIGNQTVIDFKLESDTESLDEVVVVGYGVQKKSNMTGSVTNIKADDLKTVTTPNIANMLQGKAAGVYVSANSGQPGAAPRIRIRGKSTLSGSVDPLWVVDGVIQSEAPDLNAQDIESTTVLKDASATALYGSRAANGVVLITTRGAKADQSSINVSVKTGVTQLSLGKFSMMNASEMTDYIKSFGNGYADLDWFTEEAQSIDTDWFEEGTKLGVVQDYGISFSGGNDKLTTYISGNVYDEDGAVKGYDYTRYSGRMNVDYKIRDYLTLHPKMSFTYKDITDNQQSVGEMFLNMPYDRQEMRMARLLILKMKV